MLPTRTRRLAAWVVACEVLLAGCQGRRDLVDVLTRGPSFDDEETFARKPLTTYTIPAPTDGDKPAGHIIGGMRTHRVRERETLLDLARYYDIGYDEIVEANPAIDPWVPPVGAIVVLPTAWVLPCCTYQGIVVNIPEMRLYFYRPHPRRPKTMLVETFPVGLGRDDRRTPRGKFRVTTRTVNPQWNIPESIRQEHIRERGDARRVIPGGHPDNPLGRYRLGLTVPLYSIHGTNIPWGTGTQVSHGCTRLYPEDIERLFPLVTLGTPAEFIYQPVKVGARGGELYVEVHRDIYRYAPPTYGRALAAIKQRGLRVQPDRKLLQAALRDSRGMPVRIAPTSDQPRAAASTATGGSPPEL